MKEVEEIPIHEFPLAGQHMGIGGVTGDGKTVWAVQHCRSWTAQSDKHASIFFNFKSKKKDDYEIPGDRIDGNTPKWAIKAALKGKDQVKHNGNTYDVDAGQLLKFDAHWKDGVKNKQLHGVYELCKEVSQETPESFEIRIYIEEADELGDAVDRVVKDGDGHGIYGHPISQEMKDVGVSAGTQIKEWIVMKINRNYKPWCRTMGFPYDEVYDATNSHLEKDGRTGDAPEGYYCWAHVRGDRVKDYDPITPP